MVLEQVLDFLRAPEGALTVAGIVIALGMFVAVSYVMRAGVTTKARYEARLAAARAERAAAAAKGGAAGGQQQQPGPKGRKGSKQGGGGAASRKAKAS